MSAKLPSDEAKQKAEELKQFGNKLFQEKEFNEAITAFTQGYELLHQHFLQVSEARLCAIFASNISGCWASLLDFTKALEFAELAIRADPMWYKGYQRKGTALYFQKEIRKAAAAYLKALEIEPENADVKQWIGKLNTEMQIAAEKWDFSQPCEKARPPTDTPPNIPNGNWVTMITPFTGSNHIDWVYVDHLVEFYIKNGVKGIFSVCLSSEMYNLSEQEALYLAKRVVQAANGRVPVVATGTLSKDIEKQAEFSKKLYFCTGVEAVVMVVSKMASESDSSEIWRNNVKKFIDLTGHIPLGVYECPKPYHRLMTVEELEWLCSLKRFYFLKDTTCAMTKIGPRLEILKKYHHFKLFNANIATLSQSLEFGAAGFCGIASNCYPFLISWMIENRKLDTTKATILQNFLTVGELTIERKYPQSAKTFLHIAEKGFNALYPYSRILTSFDFTEEEITRITHLNNLISFAKSELKLEKNESKNILV